MLVWPAEEADAGADVQSHIKLLPQTDFLRGGVSPQGYAPYITDGHVDWGESTYKNLKI